MVGAIIDEYYADRKAWASPACNSIHRVSGAQRQPGPRPAGRIATCSTTTMKPCSFGTVGTLVVSIRGDALRIFQRSGED